MNDSMFVYAFFFLHHSNICCLKGITYNGISVSKYNKCRQCYVTSYNKIRDGIHDLRDRTCNF